MNAASILLPAVGLSLAAYALSTHLGAGSGGAEAVVVTLPAKKTDAILPASASGAAVKTAATTTSSTNTGSMVVPGDRAGLTRELQRELKRVGCYDGDISGSWTTSSRMAMKNFTDRVNATLPIDQPDYILLTLVQRHQGKACGSDCPSGQGLSEEGRCVPAAVLAKAGKTQASEVKSSEKTAAGIGSTVGATSWSPTAGTTNDIRSPAIRGSSGLTTSNTDSRSDRAAKSAPIEVPEEKTRIAAASKADAQDNAEETPRERRGKRRSANHDGPVPEVGVYERPRKKRYAQSKPPKVVRKFLRSVQRGLAGGW